ncbi:transcription antitermination factor NusB [candidate division WWE3 bacterium RIFCSPLOWO2_01_FULL_39_13]|uniref:Transcription antitermination protein NusB n=1 Tax=candidate division WWE3 bacterium RIFCSPLOWO2_01_FULL_39_13 TaxID=1802624 RepID=A0A1F4V3Y2_UNCKA|nr:MAG: transcription antitermination factor NusB [candidate division WWE3 bacterium RIFCSPLOWO2_01_FULL_39_13]
MKTARDPRHQARRLAAGRIYSKICPKDSSNLYSSSEEDLISTLKETLEIENYDQYLFESITGSVFASMENLKAQINRNSRDWSIDKMYKMDLAVLLMAVSELNRAQTPQKVIIDEAVELAKEFCEQDSPKFINGILAGVTKENESAKS